VAISSTYLAKTGGTATFNADGTCSNVSCHGGKQSPAWTTAGTFDITVCANCHAYGTAQYNSYNSGRHKTHDDSGITCLQCHDTTKLGSNSNHFVHLETTTMEGPASATIGGGSTKVANYLNRSCTPTDTRDFPTGPCHANRTW
jgi:predicted CxxxxCH...CXXCH cytochrome family protein